MNNTNSGRTAVWLSFPLALLLATYSAIGIFLPSIYANERQPNVTGAVGADVLNVGFVVPALIVTAIFTLRGWMGARLIWMGTLLFVVYDSFYYTLDVHFNALFWAYSVVWGLSFYVLIGSLPSLSVGEVARRYNSRTAAVATATLFLVIAAGAVVHWIQETGPGVLTGVAPQSVESGHLTDVPAVLDIAFVLPALAIAAILLLRRRPLGFILGPVLLVFVALIGLIIIAIPALEAWHGHPAAYGVFVVNGPVVAVAMALVPLFLRHRADEA